MNNDEIWRDVVGYEGLYEVSNLGNVRSIDRKGVDGRLLKGVMLKQKLNNKNRKKAYLAVTLYKNNVRKTTYVHRIVAFAFCPNDDIKTKTIVNHIDGNKLNNNATNLEWTDLEGNMQHAQINGLMDEARKITGLKTGKKCSLLDLKTKKEIKFNNQAELSLYLGMNKSWLAKALSSKTNIKKKLYDLGYELQVQ